MQSWEVIVSIIDLYDYFGNVLEYQYDYFALYSRMSMITQKVLVLVPRVQSTIISSLANS